MESSNELTIAEAAALKDVGVTTIHRAIREGRLKARVELPEGSARGVWKIRREDLEAYTPASPQEKGRRGGRPRKSTEDNQDAETKEQHDTGEDR